MTTPIPQPPAIPFIGNVTSIDRDVPLRTWTLLSHTYGEIFQLNMLGTYLVYVNSYALVNEVSDEKRFKKVVGGALGQVRNLVGDGLFTAQLEEPNWGIAHRVLLPAFGPAAIRGMFDGMRDVAGQLLDKWERFGPDAIIDPSSDFTKVALDTLALCSMSYRLNSFYTEGQPPFADAMVEFLKECFLRTTRPRVVQAVMTGTTAKYEDNIKQMRDLAETIVKDRRAHPIEKKDLLTAMLSGRDPQTGEGLSDASIVNNLLTFLIAGHETSSGALSFATYYLIKNPDTMRKLREEVDSVLGDRPAEVNDLSKMPYLNAVLRETLRLQSPAPARSVTSLAETTLGGGKYAIKAGQPIVILNHAAHYDPAVWGEDVAEFKPERMLDGKFEALPPNAWQPFGYGMRGCIGRPFAWQEMQLIIASFVQRFELSLVDPSYTLDIKQALTIKPKDFYIRATPRSRAHIYATPSTGAVIRGDTDRIRTSVEDAVGDAAAKQPLYVLYGSNTGTSEAFAQRIASDGPSYGFRPSIGTLDSMAGHIPKDGPVIIVTASFEGEPADNATRFFDWLQHLTGDELVGVKFGVFGCGNHDWVQTYQRIPKSIDELFDKHGATRLVERGEGDAGGGDFFQVFDEFEANLWSTLTKEYQTSRSKSVAGLEVKTLDPGTARATALRQTDTALGRVVENRVLTKPGAPEKRHIEFELPAETTSRAGDYLSIIPHNPPRDVHRVLVHFGLTSDSEIIVSSVGPTSIPVDRPVSVSSILGGYVEISQPATTRDLKALIEATENESTRSILEDLAASYAEKVLAKRTSALDLLERYPDINLSLGAYLSLLPPMRVRQYSISSSPLWNPQHATLTVSVIAAPAISGSPQLFLGVASNFLASLQPGDRVQMAVRPSNSAFHLPADPLTPVVMFCAGSGLAPMRGFIQERAAQKQSGREIAKMLLFFGCRSPDEDYLYSDSDLAEWEKEGVVDIRPAFSRKTEASKGCKYVQDRIWHDRNDIHEAYAKGAKFYTCGAGGVASGIKAQLIGLLKEKTGFDDTTAEERWSKVIQGRYATDIFD